MQEEFFSKAPHFMIIPGLTLHGIPEYSFQFCDNCSIYCIWVEP